MAGPQCQTEQRASGFREARSRTKEVSLVSRAVTWLKQTIWEHRWALLVLAPPACAVAWLSDSSWLFVTPVIAFLLGLLLQPRHLWVLWLGAAIFAMAGALIWSIFNEPAPQPLGQEESAIEIV